MFKALGEFWMDYGAIVVLISAAITLVGVVFTLFKNNSIANGTIDKVESKGKELSGEHSRLSSEHSNIIEKLSGTKTEVTEIRQTVSEVRIQLVQNEADRKAQYANLTDAQKKLCDSAENIGKFSGEFQRLVTTNRGLAEENTRLKEELLRMTEENEALKEENLKSLGMIQHQREKIESLQTRGWEEDEDER